jgi:hypothetical protein
MGARLEAPPVVCADCAALRLQLQALAARVEALEAANRHDPKDDALRQLLPKATQQVPFAASDLLAHAARLDDAEALRGALRGAGLQSAGEVGCWLRDAQGVRDGVVIARVGKRWRATWAT